MCSKAPASTQLEFADGTKRSFEWGPRSMFAIPLNAKHRHFNGSGRKRALMVATTDMPLIMNIVPQRASSSSTRRSSSPSAPARRSTIPAKATSCMVRPGNHMWETNFVPDLEQTRAAGLGRPRRRLDQHHVRARRRQHARAHLGDADRHLQEGPPPRRRRARDVRGRQRLFAACGGTDDKDFLRIDWKHGVVFPPAEQQWHQHFNTSNRPARYLATGVGSLRYPLTAIKRRSSGTTAHRRQERGLAQHQGGRRPDRIRGSGSAHPSAMARRDAQERRGAQDGEVVSVGCAGAVYNRIERERIFSVSSRPSAFAREPDPIGPRARW